MLIHTVVPYFDNGVVVNIDDVVSFNKHKDAVKYSQNFAYYELIENKLK